MLIGYPLLVFRSRPMLSRLSLEPATVGLAMCFARLLLHSTVDDARISVFTQSNFSSYSFKLGSRPPLAQNMIDSEANVAISNVGSAYRVIHYKGLGSALWLRPHLALFSPDQALPPNQFFLA